MKTLAIIGSTGTIGESALQIYEKNKKKKSKISKKKLNIFLLRQTAKNETAIFEKSMFF